ncbi:hypothetical protein [uncultured Duncaniella sp.]|uniref:hypothetical protein n=1 Tax=uncultured Duncaniella sp. TaxID=2768039 RepID=UPI0025A971F0|nr:hypothetical protein [uncultured Duncaniella sp.]
MGKYKVIAGQNIYDVAQHLYGSIEGVVDLLINNSELSFDTVLVAGSELVYSDDFIIRADVVAYNELHGITPANGERHVYPKVFTQPFTAAITLDAAAITVWCSVSGTGLLEIDWGDNSDTENVLLTEIPQILTHTFDNKVRASRTMRWFTDARFKTVDWSGLRPRSLVLLRIMPVEELTLTDATLSLEALRLLSGAYQLNLAGIATSDLTPLAESRRLMTLDLSAARLKPTVVDGYLINLAEHYGNRRNCTVILSATPTGVYREPERDAESGRYRIGSGMEAIWVILHEETWNEGGAWKFIINDMTYTVE